MRCTCKSFFDKKENRESVFLENSGGQSFPNEILDSLCALMNLQSDCGISDV